MDILSGKEKRRRNTGRGYKGKEDGRRKKNRRV
jgi:hypothetical protein